MGATPTRGRLVSGLVAPKHYIEQYIPALAGEDEVQAIAEAEGYDNWVNLVKFKNDWALNSRTARYHPLGDGHADQFRHLEAGKKSLITGWLTRTATSSRTLIIVILTLAEDLEIINLRAIAGEYDWQARHLNMSKVPLYLENQEEKGYKLHFDTQEVGSDATVKFNMSYTDDPYLGELFRNTDFRRALALGIDREQMNEVFFLGFGVPGSFAPATTNPFSPGPDSEWRGQVGDTRSGARQSDARSRSFLTRTPKGSGYEPTTANAWFWTLPRALRSSSSSCKWPR